MKTKKNIQKSKFLSLILRHKPEEINITLDQNGWADLDELIQKSKKKGIQLDRDEIQKIVKENNKNRFSISEDGKRIRANQGHSIPVDVQLKEQIPVGPLYHGTANRFVESIMAQGIKSQNRLHVHLSDSLEVAEMVGKRHGKVVILQLNTAQMIEDGVVFYRSENGVWLTNFVDKKYIQIH